MYLKNNQFILELFRGEGGRAYIGSYRYSKTKLILHIKEIQSWDDAQSSHGGTMRNKHAFQKTITTLRCRVGLDNGLILQIPKQADFWWKLVPHRLWLTRWSANRNVDAATRLRLHEINGSYLGKKRAEQTKITLHLYQPQQGKEPGFRLILEQFYSAKSRKYFEYYGKYYLDKGFVSLHGINLRITTQKWTGPITEEIKNPYNMFAILRLKNKKSAFLFAPELDLVPAIYLKFKPVGPPK